MLAVDEIEFLDIRRILDDSAQFALVRRRFFIAHVYLNSILAKPFVHDTAILIATVVALPADHVRMVLFQRANHEGTGDRFIAGIEDHILDVNILTIDIGHRHTQTIAATPGRIHHGHDAIRLTIRQHTIEIAQLIGREEETFTDIGIAQVFGHPYIREGLLFPADELRYFNGVLPDGEPDRIVAVVDTAWGGGDSLSMPVAYVYGEDVYIQDVVFNSGDKTVTRPLVIGTLKKHHPHMVRWESNNGGDEYGGIVDEKLRDRKSVV